MDSQEKQVGDAELLKLARTSPAKTFFSRPISTGKDLPRLRARLALRCKGGPQQIAEASHLLVSRLTSSSLSLLLGLFGGEILLEIFTSGGIIAELHQVEQDFSRSVSTLRTFTSSTAGGADFLR